MPKSLGGPQSYSSFHIQSFYYLSVLYLLSWAYRLLEVLLSATPSSFGLLGRVHRVDSTIKIVETKF